MIWKWWEVDCGERCWQELSVGIEFGWDRTNDEENTTQLL